MDNLRLIKLLEAITNNCLLFPVPPVNEGHTSEHIQMVSAIGIVKKQQAGDDVNTLCGKCKCEREHVILALKTDGSIERVQCRTCQSNHLFRASKSASSSARTRTTREKASAAGEDTGPAKDYSMQSRFRVGDRIAHPRFGIGLVVEQRPGKIDVKFGRELRILVHAG
jgi:hypothetical protein